MRRIIKDPADKLDYRYDFTEFLAESGDGDTIASFTLSVPAGITEESSSNTTTEVIVWLSGGTLDAEYDIDCTITTALGREVSRILPLVMMDR